MIRQRNGGILLVRSYRSCCCQGGSWRLLNAVPNSLRGCLLIVVLVKKVFSLLELLDEVAGGMRLSGFSRLGRFLVHDNCLRKEKNFICKALDAWLARTASTIAWLGGTQISSKKDKSDTYWVNTLTFKLYNIYGPLRKIEFHADCTQFVVNRGTQFAVKDHIWCKAWPSTWYCF